MHRYNYIFSLFLSVIIFSGVVSCEGFLEKFPRSAMADEEAMENIEGIEGTLYGLYSRFIYSHLSTRNLAGCLLTDNMKIAVSNSGRFITYPDNQENTSSFVSWSARYNDINRTNMMMHYLDEVEADEDRINRAKGQAYAFRGYLYFELLNIYARPYMHQEPLVQGQPLGVIIKTEPFFGIDESSFEPRGTIEEGYQLVLDDLELAADYLSLAGAEKFPYRFSELSVNALLARVHLYMGNWQQAINYAEDVIAESPVGLVDKDNYMDAFAAAPGAESIMETAFTQDDRPHVNNSVQGVAWRSPDGVFGYGDVILRHDLIELLEYNHTNKGDVRGDIRRLAEEPGLDLTFEHDKDGQLVVFSNKFGGHRGEYYWDDGPVIRMSEMYLIAAEAYAELDNIDQSQYYLEEFRKHRMDEEHAGVDLDTREDLIDLVLTERRLEFFSEMSHRWFDLRRRGMNIPKGDPDEDPGTEVEFTDYRIVGRIPNAEIEANENAIQNPGY